MNKDLIDIIIADDNKDDCYLIRDALQEVRFNDRIHFVYDYLELLNYLLGHYKHEVRDTIHIYVLIIMLFYMPMMTRREALQKIARIQRAEKFLLSP